MFTKRRSFLDLAWLDYAHEDLATTEHKNVFMCTVCATYTCLWPLHPSFQVNKYLAVLFSPLGVGDPGPCLWFQHYQTALKFGSLVNKRRSKGIIKAESLSQTSRHYVWGIAISLIRGSEWVANRSKLQSLAFFLLALKAFYNGMQPTRYTQHYRCLFYSVHILSFWAIKEYDQSKLFFYFCKVGSAMI